MKHHLGRALQRRGPNPGGSVVGHVSPGAVPGWEHLPGVGLLYLHLAMFEAFAWAMFRRFGWVGGSVNQ